MPPARYPKAIWLGNGRSGGSYTSGPFKVVLHTTETSGLPGYDNGAYAPHLTYSPLTRAFYQHTSLLEAARALKNEAGGVQTNRDSALQLEIVCYSNRALADRYNRLWVGDLTDENLADIRGFLEWAHKEFGVALRWPEKRALSYSEANAPGFRMAGAEWDKFDGVCAHQHLPENTHWDTGALDWSKLRLEEDYMPAPKDWDAADWEAFSRHVTEASVGAYVGRGDRRRRITQILVDIDRAVVDNGVKLAALMAGSAAVGATAPEIVAEIGRLLSGG